MLKDFIGDQIIRSIKLISNEKTEWGNDNKSAHKLF